MAKHQRTVVITGCDLPNTPAYELALRLDEQGYSVFAGCSDCNSKGARSLASRGSSSLAILQIDVTKPSEITEATEMIEDSVGDEGVWALVNCVEDYSIAEVDWCSMECYERALQVNLLGTIRITKSLLHLLRRGRGRVINLSSIAGCLARAGQSAYSMTKFAMEAFSDCLRQEMLKWGVFVILVEPAYFPAEQNVTNLNNVSQKLRTVYGDEYFADFIQCVDKVTNSSDASEDKPSVSSRGSPSSRASSGYSSASSTLSTPGTEKSSTKEKVVDIKTSETTKLMASITPLNLSSTNRILHALVEAATSSSPKVRYFVGSFHDRMLKSLAPMLPTVVMDAYLTSGQISKVVPKLIKEKMD